MRYLLILAMVLLPAGVWAADGVKVLGSYINPISGTRVEMFQAYSTDPWGHNQTVTFASVTDRYGKEVNPNNLVTHDSASSAGWAGQGAAGFIGNLPNAGGLIGGAALLRPSSVNQTGGGAGSAVGDGATGGANTGAGSGAGGLTINNSASASAKASARQSQIQSQAQMQSQSQMQSQINKGGKTIIHHNNGLHLGEGHGTGNPH